MDLQQERRDESQVTWAAYRDRATYDFNKPVNRRKFQLGDLAIRKVSPITRDLNEGKLGPPMGSPLPSNQMSRQMSIPSS